MQVKYYVVMEERLSLLFIFYANPIVGILHINLFFSCNEDHLLVVSGVDACAGAVQVSS